HLPLVDSWLQAGGLYAPDCLHWYNPGGNELVAAWMVAPFSGDYLCGLTNAPAAVLLGFALVELGRNVGLSRPRAHLAGLAGVTDYVVLGQLADVSNDVAAAGLFVAGLAYALRFARGGRAADLALCAVCLGLLAGVKYYALGYTAVGYAV